MGTMPEENCAAAVCVLELCRKWPSRWSSQPADQNVIASQTITLLGSDDLDRIQSRLEGSTTKQIQMDHWQTANLNYAA